MLIRTIIFIAIVILNYACKTSFHNLAPFSNNGIVNAVIEIPAGTSLKIEYDSSSNKMKPDFREGKERIIKYLPFPANYGFIPGTKKSVVFGGDGDDVDIFVICSALKSGTVIEVIPIAVLKMTDGGENDYKVIAIPEQKQLRTVDAETFVELNEKYPGIIEIFELWLKNYDTRDEVIILGWGDEMEALIFIEQMAGADPMKM